MKNLKPLLAATGILLSLSMLATGIWRAAESPVELAAPAVAVPTVAAGQGTAGATARPQRAPVAVVLPPVRVQEARSSVPVPAVIDQSRPAELSMADARENGDRRAPPINRVAETDEPPTAAELADPKLYARYEKRQSSRGYASYVQAVNAEVPVQQAALDEARAQGMPPEMQAVAEEKIRLMQQMRDQLVAEHPEIANAN